MGINLKYGFEQLMRIKLYFVSSGIKSSGALLILVFLSLNIFTCKLNAQEIKKIDIVSDYIDFDSEVGNEAKHLIGNVRFKHEDIYMTCDSAYYYSEENIVDAFSNVHLWQGDTLNLYGDFLKYNGNGKIAQVRRNVVLIDNENKLTTDYIDHDFSRNLANYIGGGDIINGNNTLSSMQGYYYTKEKLFFFKDSVVVVNPDYTMFSDTLKYNTVTEVSYFFGPTDIIAKDNYIYCENGWYDTKNNISQFNKNAYLESEGKTLRGDSLYYERETGVGRAFYKVELIDTGQNIILQGNRAIYNENTEFAELTDRALMIQVDKGDSLFIHADTIRSVSDTIPESRMIKAYYHVKIFREDLQGKCDSLTYTDIDSVFRFYGEPVLWSDENQITAEFIEIYTKNQALDRIEIINTAFIISQEDSSRFNQIKGRDMTAYVENNQLQRIDVNGNAQTVYYAKEDMDIIGANKAESSNLQLRFRDNKIHRIVYITIPDGVYYPLDLIPENMARLENFKWFQEYRPLKKEDVFSWITNRKESQIRKVKD